MPPDAADLSVEERAQRFSELDEARPRLAEVDERVGRVVECGFSRG